MIAHIRRWQHAYAAAVWVVAVVVAVDTVAVLFQVVAPAVACK